MIDSAYPDKNISSPPKSILHYLKILVMSGYIMLLEHPDHQGGDTEKGEKPGNIRDSRQYNRG